MKLFYTKTYNLSGDNERKQKIVLVSARALGFEEISLFRFPDQCDNDEELRMRMDGITAAVSEESVVIFQYPSMVSARYDRFLLDHLKKRSGVKVVIFVQDLGKWVYPEGYTDLSEEIELLCRADLLILQSVMMKHYLNKKGLSDIPVMYQEVWDYPWHICRDSVNFEKRLDQINDISVNNLLGLKSEGAGLLSDFSSGYAEMCNPLRTGFYICAGIPVAAGNGFRAADFVSRYGIGITAETYEEAKKLVENIEDSQVIQIKSCINKIRQVISSGIFTKTLLQDAVYKVLMETLNN